MSYNVYSISEDYNHGSMQSGIILGMGSANERRRYYVTPSLIGRAHTQNDPSMLPANLQRDKQQNIFSHL